MWILVGPINLGNSDKKVSGGRGGSRVRVGPQPAFASFLVQTSPANERLEGPLARIKLQTHPGLISPSCSSRT